MREPSPTEQRAMAEIEQNNRWHAMIQPGSTLPGYSALKAMVPGQTDDWYRAFAQGTLDGLAAMDRGDVRPWADVKEELGL